ncbi:RHS repeat-associated core domain [Serratia quinivorans]|uniref:RHS repeat-associated core domain-containing protein n=1 Tax=Serratia quinivorans TaxID=137545 RepID=UPI002177E6C0|nr:RHS repeat-associated core domain-containing protein [Serratia quinivorans]CAI1566890.1 RHS repeat-associated core domain [Serratia quinivorans]CAI1696174.1 RHS repeat-associated core domain [Serratia quinivorans]
MTKLHLIGTDPMGSVVYREITATQSVTYAYSPYGELNPHQSIQPGFNGERRDPVAGGYHLGNGYRAYNPVLRRFHAPDSWSPFGDGGINPYAYCEGDPVNRSDPSGHMGLMAGGGIGLSIVGLVMAGTGGRMAIGAAKGLTTTAKVMSGLTVLTTTAGIATGIASSLVEDPVTAVLLGSASLIFGTASLSMGMGLQANGFKQRSNHRGKDIGDWFEGYIGNLRQKYSDTNGNTNTNRNTNRYTRRTNRNTRHTNRGQVQETSFGGGSHVLSERVSTPPLDHLTANGANNDRGTRLRSDGALIMDQPSTSTSTSTSTERAMGASCSDDIGLREFKSNRAADKLVFFGNSDFPITDLFPWPVY